MLQDDKAMLLFGDDDESYQIQSLPGIAPTRGEFCMLYIATTYSTTASSFGLIYFVLATVLEPCLLPCVACCQIKPVFLSDIGRVDPVDCLLNNIGC